MIRNYPKISIVTTVLNRKNTIESAIQSVLEQNYPNIEYIVIDGKSTDGTLEIINKYKEKISKIVSEPDRGLFDALNKGFKLVSGEIIGILHADDLYSNENVIKTVVEIMEKKNVDCCWGDLVYIDKENPNRIIRYWKSSEYKEGKFKWGWMPPHTTFFAKKNVYEKYGYFRLDLPIAADYELMLRFLEKYKIKSYYIPKVLVKMRIGGQSTKSILNIIKGNIESYQAWKINELKINPLRIFLKPLFKIPQYFKIFSLAKNTKFI